MASPAAGIASGAMDPAAQVEKQTRRNRVRRGRRIDGVLVAIGDADPEIGYTCPICGDSLRQKRSCLEKPFFAHIGGDGTCADDAIRHAAAVRVLADLVDHALAGRMSLRFSGRCMAGRHAVDQSLEVRPGDIVRRDDHGVAILRDGAPIGVLVVHRTHGGGMAVHVGDAVVSYAVDADDVLGWDADAALEACQAGGNATLALAATATSGGVPCVACAREQESERKKADKAAATAAKQRTERCQAFADAIQRSRGLFETDFCPNHQEIRRVIDITGHYDDIVVDCMQDGERWDVALIKANKLKLGILIVKPDAMVNVATPDHRCRNPGNTCFVAVPENADVDPVNSAWPTNAWHLLSRGTCPRCYDLPRLVAKVGGQEAAFVARFQAGRREMRPDQIRSEFLGTLWAEDFWCPRIIKADMQVAIEAAIERLLAAAALVWPPSTAEARRTLEAKELTGSVDRICAAYARKHLAADKPPKSAAEIHRAIHWVLDRGDGMTRADQASIEPHIAASIDTLVKQAWALWPGHEAKAAAIRKRRRAEEAMGRGPWGRRRHAW